MLLDYTTNISHLIFTLTFSNKPLHLTTLLFTLTGLQNANFISNNQQVTTFYFNVFDLFFRKWVIQMIRTNSKPVNNI